MQKPPEERVPFLPFNFGSLLNFLSQKTKRQKLRDKIFGSDKLDIEKARKDIRNFIKLFKMSPDKNDTAIADSYIYRQIRIEIALAEERARHEKHGKPLEQKQEALLEEESPGGRPVKFFGKELPEPRNSEEGLELARDKIRAIHKALRIMRRRSTKVALNFEAAVSAAKNAVMTTEATSNWEQPSANAIFKTTSSLATSLNVTEGGSDEEQSAPSAGVAASLQVLSTSPGVQLGERTQENRKSRSQFFKRKEKTKSREGSPMRIEDSKTGSSAKAPRVGSTDPG